MQFKRIISSFIIIKGTLETYFLNGLTLTEAFNWFITRFQEYDTIIAGVNDRINAINTDIQRTLITFTSTSPGISIISSSGLSNEYIISTDPRFLSSPKFKIDLPSGTIQVISHNLNSDNISVQVWVFDNGLWRNHIVGITILDIDNIQIELLEPYPIRVLVEDYN